VRRQFLGATEAFESVHQDGIRLDRTADVAEHLLEASTPPR
jgi:hypothetical protein